MNDLINTWAETIRRYKGNPATPPGYIPAGVAYSGYLAAEKQKRQLYLAGTALVIVVFVVVLIIKAKK